MSTTSELNIVRSVLRWGGAVGVVVVVVVATWHRCTAAMAMAAEPAATGNVPF